MSILAMFIGLAYVRGNWKKLMDILDMVMDMLDMAIDMLEKDSYWHA